MAEDGGIAKRYLQALLAASGTSFVQELNATCLDRAREMVADQRSYILFVADIALRNGSSIRDLSSAYSVSAAVLR